jgi:hypothetical protein
LYVNDPDEEEYAHNLPRAKRSELLALLEDSGVVAVLAGHTHTTSIRDYKGIQLVIGGATSLTGDGEPLGFRLWHVDSPASITHEFIPLTLEIPTPDFNGDGIVDSTDICIMVDYWGTDDALCDIAPMPWRDGMVDVNDLIVLAGFLGKEVEDPTLIAHWAFDEAEGDVAYDSAGGNDAIIVGRATWQPDGGAVGGALTLDGVDDHVITPSVLSPADGPFGVLAWVKGDTPGQVILSQASGNDWLLTDAGGALITHLKGTGRKATSLHSQTIITDGQWHRIGLTWDGPGRALLVDGVTIAEDEPGLQPGVSGVFLIGTGVDLEPDSLFSGLIDDVRIYNREVRP